MSMHTTIVGGKGFVGGHLAAFLRALAVPCWVPARGDLEMFKRPLGTVYYCAGVTADFRLRPYETVDAHAGLLREILEKGDFDQLVYLSSTRVYAGSSTAHESLTLRVSSIEPDCLYNISKLMGESLALASARNCRVVRLSNVLGAGMGAVNFVGALVAEAQRFGAVHFRTALESEKDYIGIEDVVTGLHAISVNGSKPIYNLAVGQNVTHAQFASGLAANGIKITVAENAMIAKFPPISIENLVNDTGFRPQPIAPHLNQTISHLLKQSPN